jgi:CBS domain-containing protein
MNADEAKELLGYRKRPLITIDVDSPVHDALSKMEKAGIHHLVVLKNGKYLGVVSSAELARATRGSNWYGSARVPKVSEAVHYGVPLVSANADVQTVLKLMIENGLTAIPLQEEGEVTDIVTETDMLRVLEYLLKESHSRHQKDKASLVDKGEAALASPFAQKIMRTLSEAGI